MLRPPFPSILELPEVLIADGWSWERFDARGSSDHWVGGDLEGRRWLVKMGGGFQAVRERAFGFLAQRLGLACQSSALLRLREDSAPLIETPEAGPYQVALVFLARHPSDCGSGCPTLELGRGWKAAPNPVAALGRSRVRFALDWVKGNMLGALCGATERCEVLWTQDHALVLIDNEQAFSGPPANLWDCGWRSWEGPRDPLSGDPVMSQLELRLARSLCRDLVAVPSVDLRRAVSIPRGYRAGCLWPLLPRLTAAQKAARAFLAGAPQRPAGTRPRRQATRKAATREHDVSHRGPRGSRRA